MGCRWLGGENKMFVNERGNIEIIPQTTYSAIVYPFLWWEIERVIYPKFKIMIRRRERDLK